LEEGLANLDETTNGNAPAPPARTRRGNYNNNNNTNSFWSNGKNGGGQTNAFSRDGAIPSVLRDKFGTHTGGNKNKKISAWKRWQPLLFAAILIGFPLSNAVFFFRRARDADVVFLGVVVWVRAERDDVACNVKVAEV
jgi:hypothetical protein